ncbi:hypothetical protein [Mycolicibacterium sp. XJ1819]
MTGPDDSQSNTRPISVAELLARNGTIGAPPVGGRRRRRRGDGSVTVAELTGEIPIVRDEAPEDEPAPTAEAMVAVDDEPEAAVEKAEVPQEIAEKTPEELEAPGDRADTDTDAEDEDAEDTEDTDGDYADAVSDYAEHVSRRETDEDLDFFTPPRRSAFAPRRFGADGAGAAAEQMSPDPGPDLTEDDDAAVALVEPDLDEDLDDEETDLDVAGDTDLDVDDRDELPSYLRSTGGTLFGGQTVADDLARGGPRETEPDAELEDDLDDAAQPSGMSRFTHAALVVGQCVLAVAFGAGLFVAFDQLWMWNNIVALVLSVLVILGLVVGVRVVRKTEDIGSTLIAVAVGALVTLGPLALLQSG